MSINENDNGVGAHNDSAPLETSNHMFCFDPELAKWPFCSVIYREENKIRVCVLDTLRVVVTVRWL